MSRASVFVTDGAIRRTLAAARGLAAAGFDVVTGDERARSLTAVSRACGSSIRYPSPQRSPRAFGDALLQHLREHPTDVLLPMAQETLDLILARRLEFESLTSLPFAANDRYLVFRDKARTMALAQKSGLPTAATVWSQDRAELRSLVRSLRFPVIIKPRFGWASRGMSVVPEPALFDDAYVAVHAAAPFPLVQEFVPVREKFHVNVLVGHGAELLAACTVKELRHHPHERGASTAQECVDRPDLIALATALVSANKWFGLASVDILIDDRDGAPIIAEVNPRFWGSLHVAIAAGVDFASMAARLALGSPQVPVLGGQVGVKSRCMVPYDLLYLGGQLRSRQAIDPLFFSFRDTHDDILSRQDPAPAMALVMSMGQRVFDPDAWAQLAGMNRVGAVISKVRRRDDSGNDTFAEATRELFATSGPSSTGPEPFGPKPVVLDGLEAALR